MPQTFLARLLPLERPYYARPSRRDLRRARGRIPSLRNSRVCRARPPVCTRTAMLLDARRADLERIRLVPATGAGLRLAILRRGSIGLVWKLAMVGSFGRPIARHNSVGLPPNSPTPSRSELLVVVAGVALIALAVLAL